MGTEDAKQDDATKEGATRTQPSSVFPWRKHNNNASKKEDYVRKTAVVGNNRGQARLSPGSRSNSTQQTSRLDARHSNGKTTCSSWRENDEEQQQTNDQPNGNPKKTTSSKDR
jgi:hypothetical protein